MITVYWLIYCNATAMASADDWPYGTLKSLVDVGRPIIQTIFKNVAPNVTVELIQYSQNEEYLRKDVSSDEPLCWELYRGRSERHWTRIYLKAIAKLGATIPFRLATYAFSPKDLLQIVGPATIALRLAATPGGSTRPYNYKPSNKYICVEMLYKEEHSPLSLVFNRAELANSKFDLHLALFADEADGRPRVEFLAADQFHTEFTNNRVETIVSECIDVGHDERGIYIYGGRVKKMAPPKFRRLDHFEALVGRLAVWWPDWRRANMPDAMKPIIHVVVSSGSRKVVATMETAKEKDNFAKFNCNRYSVLCSLYTWELCLSVVHVEDRLMQLVSYSKIKDFPIKILTPILGFLKEQ